MAALKLCHFTLKQHEACILMQKNTCKFKIHFVIVILKERNGTLPEPNEV